jgi:hypothetical protein
MNNPHVVSNGEITFARRDSLQGTMQYNSPAGTLKLTFYFSLPFPSFTTAR